MATLLLCVIYIAFIGLGLPDSLLGSAWPAIHLDFGVPVAYANFISMLSSLCTITASLNSARVINRFGIGGVIASSTALTVVSLLGYTLSPGFWWLFVLTIPMGLGAGAIDTGLNNYVALHYNANHMSFLHCFYGVGVTLSPYLMSLALSDQGQWRNGYRLAFSVQLVIMLITIAALPLWKRMEKPAQNTVDDVPPRMLSLRELARIPAVRAVWIVFITSCGIEFTVGGWCSTYLVKAKGMPMDIAARMAMLFYMGMAVGRFFSGVLAGKLTAWQLIRYSEMLVLCSIVFLFLPLGMYAAAAGLFLIGLGVGPLFPNMTHLAPKNFGRDVSQSVIGSQMASSTTGIMLLPPLFGLMTQFIGAWLFPWYLLLLFAAMGYATLKLISLMKKEGRYN